MNQDRTKRESWLRYAGPAMAAALIMGLPTLRGGFVGGDDHRLALDHVLVNRPSFSHALELFHIIHRDLYQPLPLLSYAAEFVVVHAFGLAEKGPQAFAWIFHLDNVLLHVINTGLVWAVVLRLLGGGAGASDRRERLIAATAAMLFAVHPFQTEVVAWVNGRMMLMSTLFALLMLLSFTALAEEPQGQGHRRKLWRLGAWTVLFALACSMSKVRVELPVLLMIMLWARGLRLNRSVIAVVGGVGVVTAVFIAMNIYATAEANLFQVSGEHLRGPRLARIAMALAFYFTRFVWPVGLSSHYPTPADVYWSDAASWQSAMVVAFAGALILWLSIRSRDVRLGVLWFFAAIFAVLPIVPARNILAADRYMYLPMIGLLWPLSKWMFTLYDAWIKPRAAIIRRGIVPAAVVGLIALLIGVCWHTGSFYNTALRKSLRVAQLFPDVPRIWEYVGWSYYELGEYDRAIECAHKELRKEGPAVHSGAYQLLGLTALKQGHGEQAIRWLHKAVETDPRASLGWYRLATAYDELGELEKGLPYLEAAAKDAPSHNPTLHRLAKAYRRLERPDDARKLYEQELENNRFEWPATLALAELDIETRNAESLRRTETRLLGLLDWMPDNVAARVSLGVVHNHLGRANEAMEDYRLALIHEPHNVTALLNLAQIFQAAGEPARATPLFERAASIGAESVGETEAIADFHLDRREGKRAVATWWMLLARDGRSKDAQGMLAWTLALAGQTQDARSRAEALAGDARLRWMSHATLTIADFLDGEYASAMNRAGGLASEARAAAEARRRLLRALERYDHQNASNAWTYCLSAKLLAEDARPDAAVVFLGLCEQHCADTACREQVGMLREEMAAAGAQTSTSGAAPAAGPH